MVEPSPLARRVTTVRAALRKNLERLNDYVGEPDEDLLKFFSTPAPPMPTSPPVGGSDVP